jgi:thymidylate synthase
VYLPVPSQPDCATAWLEAVKLVDGQHGHDGQSGHQAMNVIIDIADPTAAATLAHPVVALVNDFLMAQDKSIEAVANTIFPSALYGHHGSPGFIKVFHDRVLPKVRKNKNWSGYYFERMTVHAKADGRNLDQLSELVGRIRDKSTKSLHNHQVVVFDPERDATDSVYGGQCLSFLNFHLLPTRPKTLVLTAQYRNHYYIEKLLGNLIGLGRLMAYIAKETDTRVGDLTVVSTHATIDLPEGASRQDVLDLIERSQTMVRATRSAA